MKIKLMLSKKTIEKGEFENNYNQNEGSKSQSLSVWSKDFSAGDIILMAHLKEAVENTAKFESSEHLNPKDTGAGGNPLQAPDRPNCTGFISCF